MAYGNVGNRGRIHKKPRKKKMIPYSYNIDLYVFINKKLNLQALFAGVQIGSKAKTELVPFIQLTPTVWYVRYNLECQPGFAYVTLKATTLSNDRISHPYKHRIDLEKPQNHSSATDITFCIPFKSSWTKYYYFENPVSQLLYAAYLRNFDLSADKSNISERFTLYCEEFGEIINNINCYRAKWAGPSQYIRAVIKLFLKDDHTAYSKFAFIGVVLKFLTSSSEQQKNVSILLNGIDLFDLMTILENIGRQNRDCLYTLFKDGFIYLDSKTIVKFLPISLQMFDSQRYPQLQRRCSSYSVQFSTCLQAIFDYATKNPQARFPSLINLQKGKQKTFWNFVLRILNNDNYQLEKFMGQVLSNNESIEITQLKKFFISSWCKVQPIHPDLPLLCLEKEFVTKIDATFLKLCRFYHNNSLKKTIKLWTEIAILVNSDSYFESELKTLPLFNSSKLVDEVMYYVDTPLLVVNAESFQKCIKDCVIHQLSLDMDLLNSKAVISKLPKNWQTAAWIKILKRKPSAKNSMLLPKNTGVVLQKMKSWYNSPHFKPKKKFYTRNGYFALINPKEYKTTQSPIGGDIAIFIKKFDQIDDIREKMINNSWCYDEMVDVFKSESLFKFFIPEEKLWGNVNQYVEKIRHSIQMYSTFKNVYTAGLISVGKIDQEIKKFHETEVKVIFGESEDILPIDQLVWLEKLHMSKCFRNNYWIPALEQLKQNNVVTFDNITKAIDSCSQSWKDIYHKAITLSISYKELGSLFVGDSQRRTEFDFMSIQIVPEKVTTNRIALMKQKFDLYCMLDGFKKYFPSIITFLQGFDMHKKDAATFQSLKQFESNVRTNWDTFTLDIPIPNGLKSMLLNLKSTTLQFINDLIGTDDKILAFIRDVEINRQLQNYIALGSLKHIRKLAVIHENILALQARMATYLYKNKSSTIEAFLRVVQDDELKFAKIHDVDFGFVHSTLVELIKAIKDKQKSPEEDATEKVNSIMRHGQVIFKNHTTVIKYNNIVIGMEDILELYNSLVDIAPTNDAQNMNNYATVANFRNFVENLQELSVQYNNYFNVNYPYTFNVPLTITNDNAISTAVQKLSNDIKRNIRNWNAMFLEVSEKNLFSNYFSNSELMKLIYYFIGYYNLVEYRRGEAANLQTLNYVHALLFSIFSNPADIISDLSKIDATRASTEKYPEFHNRLIQKIRFFILDMEDVLKRHKCKSVVGVKIDKKMFKKLVLQAKRPIYFVQENSENNCLRVLLSLFFGHCNTIPDNVHVLIADSTTSTTEIQSFVKRWEKSELQNGALYCVCNFQKLQMSVQDDAFSFLNQAATAAVNPLVVLCCGVTTRIETIKHVIGNATTVEKLQDQQLRDVFLQSAVGSFKEFRVFASKFAGQGKSSSIMHRISKKYPKAYYENVPIRSGDTKTLIASLNERIKHLKDNLTCDFSAATIVFHICLYESTPSSINYTIWKLIMYKYLSDNSSGDIFHLEDNMVLYFELPSLNSGMAETLEKFYSLKVLKQIQIDSIEQMSVEELEKPAQNHQIIPKLRINMRLMHVVTLLEYYYDALDSKKYDMSAYLSEINTSSNFLEKKISHSGGKCFTLLWRAVKCGNSRPTLILLHNFVNFMYSFVSILPKFQCFRYAPAFFEGKDQDGNDTKKYEFGKVFAYTISRLLVDTSVVMINRSFDWTKDKFDYITDCLRWEDREQCILLLSYTYNYTNYGGIIKSERDEVHSVNFLATDPELYDQYFPRTTNVNKLFRLMLQQQGIEFGSDLSTLDFPVKALNGMEPGYNEDIIGKRIKLLSAQYTACTNSYVMTRDNFFKMVFIECKLSTGLTVILESEAGVGKTSLIEYLAISILDSKLFILKVNGGTSSVDVDEFLAPILSQHNHGELVHVFFDEFNTAPAETISLFKEIFCDRKYYGNPIDKQIRIIGAINPYREISHSERSEGLYYYGESQFNQKHYKNLVYRVNPISPSFYEHVYDFGWLQSSEKLYINRMIEVGLKDSIFSNTPKVHKAEFTKLILVAHKVLRDLSNDPKSAASLRDVKRTVSLFNWFYNGVGQHLLELIDSKSKELDAMTLSIFVCYCCRLKESGRKKFWSEIFAKINANSTALKIKSERYFQKLVKKVRMKFVKFLVIDGTEFQHIAMNKALSENLFVGFVAIANKIPLFIIGKPGTSKSLSISILMQNLSNNSNSPLHKWGAPKIQHFFYQCSPESTEQAVKTVFDSARKFNKNIMPVVVLDEVGLAPILKILHEELEFIDQLHKKGVMVIGLSNWCLDSAQMNRAIYLERTTPQKKDLIESATEIVNSIARWTEKLLESDIIKLVNVYLKLEEKQDKNRPYFGLRDVYTMLKSTVIYQKEFARDECEEGEYTDSFGRMNIYKIFWKAICHNFNSRSDYRDLIAKTFIAEFGIDYPFIDTRQLIIQNLTGEKRRHLMVLTKNMAALPIVKDTLVATNQKFEVVIGSNFEGDNKYFTNMKNLRKVAHCMQKGIKVIMVFADDLFPPLYDILNQHYKRINRQEFGLIAMGPSTVEFRVHPDFRIIVIIDATRCVNELDTPLIQRFETQSLIAKDLAAKNPYLPMLLESINTMKINIRVAIPCFHPDLQYSLIQKVISSVDANSEDFESKAKSVLKDLLCKLIKPSYMLGIKNNNKSLYDEYLGKYLICNFKEFLSKTKSVKRTILLTYSPKFAPKNTFPNSKVIKLWNVAKESELHHQLHEIINKDDYVLVLQHDSRQGIRKFVLAKYLLMTLLAGNQHKGKVIFIVHVSPVASHAEELQFSYSFEKDWEYYFVDEIYEKPHSISTYLTKSFSEMSELVFSDHKSFLDFVQQNILQLIINFSNCISFDKADIDKLIGNFQRILSNESLWLHFKKLFTARISRSESWSVKNILQQNAGYITENSLSSFLEQELHGQHIKLISTIVNHFNTFDNLATILRPIGCIDLKLVEKIFMNLIGMYHDPPKHFKVKYESKSYSVCFPFSFQIYSACETMRETNGLQELSNFNELASQSVLEYLKKFSDDCTVAHVTDLMDAYSSDFVQYKFSNISQALATNNISIFGLLRRITDIALDKVCFLEFHYLIEQNKTFIFNVIKLLDLGLNLQMMEEITPFEIVSQVIENLAQYQKQFDDRKTREEFAWILIEAKPIVEYFISKLPVDDADTDDVQNQWTRILITQKVLSIILVNKRKSLLGLPKIIEQDIVPQLGTSLKIVDLKKVVDNLWKFFNNHLLTTYERKYLEEDSQQKMFKCGLKYIHFKSIRENRNCTICGKFVSSIEEHYEQVGKSEFMDIAQSVTKKLFKLYWLVEEIISLIFERTDSSALGDQFEEFLQFAMNPKYLGRDGIKLDFSETFLTSTIKSSFRDIQGAQRAINKTMVSLKNSRNDVNTMNSFLSDGNNMSRQNVLFSILSSISDRFESGGSFETEALRINKLPVHELVYATPWTFQRMMNLNVLKSLLLKKPEMLHPDLFKIDAIALYYLQHLHKTYGFTKTIALIGENAHMHTTLCKNPKYVKLENLVNNRGFSLTLIGDALVKKFNRTVVGVDVKPILQGPIVLQNLSKDFTVLKSYKVVEEFGANSFTRLLLHTSEFFLKTKIEPYYSLLCDGGLVADSLSSMGKILQKTCFPANPTSVMVRLCLADLAHAAMCPNGHPYLIANCGQPMTVKTCQYPECGVQIGGRGHVFLANNKRATKADLMKIPDPTGIFIPMLEESIGDKGELNRFMTQASFRFIKLITNLCMLSGLLSSKEYHNRLREILMDTGINKSIVPKDHDDMVDAILQRTTSHFKLLCKLQNLNYQSGFEFTHRALNRMANLNLSTTLSDYKENVVNRNLFEKSVTTLIENVGIIEAMSRESNERCENNDETCQYEKNLLQPANLVDWKWRLQTKITNLQALAAMNNKAKYPLISVYIAKAKNFEALSHFEGMNLFLSKFYSFYEEKLTDEESVEKTFKNFIDNSHLPPENTKRLFSAFAYVFNNFLPTVQAVMCHELEEYGIKPTFQISLDSPIKFSCSVPNDERAILGLILQTAMTFHNDFLDSLDIESISIAKSKTLNLPIQNANFSSNTIASVKQSDVLDFINNHNIDENSLVILEDYLRQQLVYGKKKINIIMRNFTFKRLAKNFVYDFEEKELSQEPLQDLIAKRIISGVKQNLHGLFEFLELIMIWCCKFNTDVTSVYADLRLLEFARKMPSIGKLSIFKSIFEFSDIMKDIQMKHVLWLYKAVKGAIFTASDYPQRFKKALNDADKLQLDDCFAKMKCLLLFRVWRQLFENIPSTANLETPLIEYLGCCATPNGAELYSESWFNDYFPPSIPTSKSVTALVYLMDLYHRNDDEEEEVDIEEEEVINVDIAEDNNTEEVGIDSADHEDPLEDDLIRLSNIGESTHIEEESEDEESEGGDDEDSYEDDEPMPDELIDGMTDDFDEHESKHTAENRKWAVEKPVTNRTPNLRGEEILVDDIEWEVPTDYLNKSSKVVDEDDDEDDDEDEDEGAVVETQYYDDSASKPPGGQMYFDYMN